ncbi:hypothetical protein EBQ93_02360, partial [bacterium]|nr:hypothetical protein [bacterium]
MKNLLLSSMLLLGITSNLSAAAGGSGRANIISYSEAFELLKAADDKEKFDVLRQIFIEYHLKIDMASHSDEELKKTMFLIDNLYPQFYALIFTILQAKQNITKESILEIL